MLTTHPPGDNCFILEDNTIQPFVRIGNNVTLWRATTSATTRRSAITASSPRTSWSRHCTIGESCFIGVNATLRNSITIADRTLIGAGAVVMGDTRPAAYCRGG